MNPTLELGLAEFERILDNKDARPLDEAERGELAETVDRFFSLRLGRAKKGRRTRSLPCLNKDGLLSELGATAKQKTALSNSELKLVCTQDIEEPDIRFLVVFAVEPNEDKPLFTIEMPIFQFYANRGDSPLVAPLEIVPPHGRFIPVNPGSPAHQDIRNIAEFFLPQEA